MEKTPNYKRVLALSALVLIIGLIVAFLLVALFGGPDSKDLFMGLAGAVVAVPILTWLLIWSIGAITGRHTIASLDAMSSNKKHDKYGNVIPDGEIDTIVFDIGNVLTDFAWDKFLVYKGYDDAMVERIAKATVYSDDWVEYDKGNLTNDEIIARFVENDPEIKSDIEDSFKNIDGIILKREKTIPWIRALKAAGYKVLYLSNFSKQALEGCPDAMEFLAETDGGILSYREHVVKPDPAIYNLLVSRYNLTPSKTVFIDDTPVNIEAAKKLGWKGIIYRDYNQVVDELATLGVKF
ncbi:haloacid dehalogenase superfamily, subfamily IA, variant 3 with third motif having DD or ED [Butyrivibrio proteoclasticus]|uniref:Haloacid dehalogenase superfamily, subfamily IA, variant 3 with third motif having DD or ED n=1 Tax=Butyrivibrio proteoclasticus TaxID=43305 RepID=A0A1I5XJQ1_9FIRM|nr:HAD family phosphatase [Butyrivibrio proteoclasticus]SFQ32169.1 haloacid dehalogenase superfamily, subfamily IA, variant 3 with third motif having DD or ED [Butyrivibrio proteoclasticus]